MDTTGVNGLECIYEVFLAFEGNVVVVVAVVAVVVVVVVTYVSCNSIGTVPVLLGSDMQYSCEMLMFVHFRIPAMSKSTCLHVVV